MKRHCFSIAAGLLLALVFAGCAVGPNYRQPKTLAPERFSGSEGFTTATSRLDTTWWRVFNDPLLERLITQATTNNYDLRLAEARLREARALWTAARFDYAPSVRSENRYESTRRSEDDLGNRERDSELYRVGFDATWELDLWGAVRRNVEAARATVESIAASREDTLITVQAEVAVSYAELRGAQAQLAVAQRNATNQAQILRLAETLRDGGQGTQLDVARAQSLWNATLASIPPLEVEVDRAMHRIAVLLGQPPSTLRWELHEPGKLLVIPTELSITDPTEVLRRRPDVRAAERSLAAAMARIGIEAANLFPRVTFVGTVGLQAGSFSGLADSGAQTWGFGPHISWAAFDLGRVRQQIKAADARAEGALAIYQQTVLLALEETENALVSLGRERQRLAFLQASERAAAEATDLARQRYRDGIADFLSVLDAERTLLDLQEQIVTSQTLTATRLLALFKALASGLNR